MRNQTAVSLSGFDELRAQASGTGVFVREDDDSLALHFDLATVQSRMLRDAPERLVLGYTRTMMGFLLLTPQPRKICMIGLGGGSMPKYCHAKLPQAAIAVVEIDADVIALREQFQVPADSDRFHVLQMDGADYMRAPMRAFDGPCEGPFDVIVVDGFDSDGQPTQLCSLAFYDNAFARLAENGVMAVNLHHNALYEIALARLNRSFDDAVIVVDCETSANRIAFAFKGNLPAVLNRELSARVRQLSAHDSIDLCRTARRMRRAWLDLTHPCSESDPRVAGSVALSWPAARVRT